MHIINWPILSEVGQWLFPQLQITKNNIKKCYKYNSAEVRSWSNFDLTKEYIEILSMYYLPYFAHKIRNEWLFCSIFSPSSVWHPSLEQPFQVLGLSYKGWPHWKWRHAKDFFQHSASWCWIYWSKTKMALKFKKNLKLTVVRRLCQGCLSQGKFYNPLNDLSVTRLLS